jgi:hypothetical protein
MLAMIRQRRCGFFFLAYQDGIRFAGLPRRSRFAQDNRCSWWAFSLLWFLDLSGVPDALPGVRHFQQARLLISAVIN